MSKLKIKVDESLYPELNGESANKGKQDEKSKKKSDEEHTLKDDLEDYVEELEAEADSPINSANLKSEL